MKNFKNGNRTLSVALTRDIPVRRELVLALGVVMFAFLTAAGAYVRIPLPLTPVPITLQTFFVLLSAATLGPVFGTASMGLYVALGIAGMPMFTLTGGIAHLAGPTGGYIIGFLIAQPVVGLILGSSPSKASVARIATSLVAGLAVIFTLGASHLYFMLGRDITSAIMLGVVPFLPGALVKTVATGAVIAKGKKSFLIR